MLEQNHDHHILPLALYLKVAGALLILTIVTVWVAQYDFGSTNLVVALAIAAFKGTIVGLFFMHLKYSNRLFAAVLIGAIAMVAIFIVFTMFDTMTRDEIYMIRSQSVNPRAVIYPDIDNTALNNDSAGLVDSLTAVVDSTVRH
jgi:cytochrome c oxidase subunit 4